MWDWKIFFSTCQRRSYESVRRLLSFVSAFNLSVAVFTGVVCSIASDSSVYPAVIVAGRSRVGAGGLFGGSDDSGYSDAFFAATNGLTRQPQDNRLEWQCQLIYQYYHHGTAAVAGSGNGSFGGSPFCRYGRLLSCGIIVVFWLGGVAEYWGADKDQSVFCDFFSVSCVGLVGHHRDFSSLGGKQ